MEDVNIGGGATDEDWDLQGVIGIMEPPIGLRKEFLSLSFCLQPQKEASARSINRKLSLPIFHLQGGDFVSY